MGDEHYSMAQEFLRSLGDEQASGATTALATPPQKQRARPRLVSPPRSAPDRARPPPGALPAHPSPTPAELADAVAASGSASDSAGGGAVACAEAREEVHVPMMMHVSWDELGPAAEGAPPVRAVLRGQGLVRALCWCPGLEPARRLELLRVLLEASTTPVDVDDIDPRDGCTVLRRAATLGARGCSPVCERLQPRVPEPAAPCASRCCTDSSRRDRCPSRVASSPRRAVPRRRPHLPRRCYCCRWGCIP